MRDRSVMAGKSVKGNYVHHLAWYNDSMRNLLIEEQDLLNNVETSLANHEFEIYIQMCIRYSIKADWLYETCLNNLRHIHLNNNAYWQEADASLWQADTVYQLYHNDQPFLNEYIICLLYTSFAVS